MDPGPPGPTGTLRMPGSPWIFSSASWRWKFLSLQQPLTLSEGSCPHQQGLVTKSAQTVHSCSKARWRGGHLSPACLGQLLSRTEEPEKVWGRLYPLEPGRLLGSIEGALFRLTLGVSLSRTVRDSPLGDPGWPCAWLKVFGEKCNKSQKATLLWWRASGQPDAAGSITASDGLGFSGLFLRSVRENNAQPHQGFHYKSP